MSDYTPTTEQVRRAYQDSQDGMIFPDQGAPDSPEEIAAEFDRWYAAEIRKAKAEALREAAERLDESTQADVNNYIGRPAPTFSHTERYADVQWLRQRAADIEMGKIDE